MTLRAILLAGLFALFAGDAAAGAWPRERGGTFASTAVRLSWPQDPQHRASPDPSELYYTGYLEYGLTDKITLGLDLGRSVSGHGKTVAFLQYPIRARDRGPRIAAALGLGRIGGETVIRPGLFMGWGLEKGWFTIETLLEYQFATGDADYKIDMTWGRNLPRDRKLILQLQTGDTATDPPFTRLAPSLVFPLRGQLKLEAGATYGIRGDRSVGLKFGLWSEF